MLATPGGDAPGDYLPRYLDSEIEELLSELPALAIDGAEGGSARPRPPLDTTTTFSNSTPPEVRQLVELDMTTQLQRAERLCVDEWRKYPSVRDGVRRPVDRGSTTRFVLTGSATPTTGDTHSGAGRIVSVRLRPLSLAERRSTTPTVFLSELFAGTARIGGETDFQAADYARESPRRPCPCGPRPAAVRPGCTTCGHATACTRST